jgi:hypothetical protein
VRKREFYHSSVSHTFRNTFVPSPSARSQTDNSSIDPALLRSINQQHLPFKLRRSLFVDCRATHFLIRILTSNTSAFNQPIDTTSVISPNDYIVNGDDAFRFLEGAQILDQHEQSYQQQTFRKSFTTAFFKTRLCSAFEHLHIT